MITKNIDIIGYINNLDSDSYSQFVISKLEKLNNTRVNQKGICLDGCKLKEVNYYEIMTVLNKGQEFFFDEDSYKRFIEVGEQYDSLFEESLIVIPNEDDQVFYQVKCFSF